MKNRVRRVEGFIATVVMFSLLILPGLAGAADFFYANGKKISLPVSEDRIAVRFKTPQASMMAQPMLSAVPALSTWPHASL